jgi:uncharacterized membrane protein
MDEDIPYADNDRSPYWPQRDNSGTTSLILGILSLVCGITGLASLVGTILGIIGIVQGNKNRKHDPLARTGFILSVIGLVLSSLLFVAFIGFIALFGAMAWRPMGMYW